MKKILLFSLIGLIVLSVGFSIGAVGGTVTTSGVYTIHTLNSSGWINFTSGGSIRMLLIAGGGGGGAGGGGAGGVIYDATYIIGVGNYPVVIGTGGIGMKGLNAEHSASGLNSTFNSLIAVGGGQGGYNDVGGWGGSGGGGCGSNAGGTALSGQGFAGGQGEESTPYQSGGGGGASSLGLDYTTQSDGGEGVTYDINGTSICYAGGGGGGSDGGDVGTATCGGGAGVVQSTGISGADGFGSGGGGVGGYTGASDTYAGKGGDGILIISYIPTIDDYNVTQIFDNSSIHNFRFNTTQSLNFTGYNSTGFITPQILNVNISDLSINQNETSNVYFDVTFNNSLISNYSVIVSNPYNSSVSETFYFTINDVKNISYINTSTFFKYNITQSLNFTNNLDTGIYTCDDYYNLTIPSLNISNRLIKSCELTSVTFNNSLIYNYTTYLTNERFSRIINNTVYFYTNAYNNTIPNYNQTIVNNTITDIKWYLNTFPNYASSNQNINVTIDFNGTTTTPTASALNYTYFNLLTSDELVETVPFYLILNLTYGTESLLFNESYTQSITTLQLDNCSTYSNTLMWLHIKDELDLNRVDLVPNSSVYMSFNVNGGYFTLNVINDTDGVIQVCTNNSVNFTADVDFSYIAENFGASTKPNREHFFFKTYFNNIINQSFYKLPTANAEKIIFNLVDNAQQPLVNYYLNIKKWYGDGYSTVAIAKTDINGQAITYVEYNIPNYAFDILNENGTLVDSTENIILTTTPTTIQVDEGTGVSSYFVDNNSYGYINVWNNGTEYFTTIMNNENSVDTTFKLLVYYSNGSILCSETSTQTTSYTTMCEVPDWSNQTFIVRGSLIRNNDNRFILLYNYLIDDRLPTTPIFDTDEGLLWLAIMIIVSSVGIVAISPSFLPLSPAISLLLTNALGLTSISVFMIGGLTVTGIILMLWFMKT